MKSCPFLTFAILAATILLAMFAAAFSANAAGAELRLSNDGLSSELNRAYLKSDIHFGNEVARNTNTHLTIGVIPQNGKWFISPVSLQTRSLGGGNWRYNPETGAGQKATIAWRWVKTPESGWIRKLTDVPGLNNIGLLVKTSGKVVELLTDGFYLDDFSGCDDGDPTIPGVRIAVPADVTIPAKNSYVSVTGISSCYKDDEGTKRLLKVRIQEDIVVIRNP